MTARFEEPCKTCAGPCVFVVEPGEGLRRSMQLLLAYYGYEVRAYAGADAAIAGLRGCAVACVVTGLVLDEADGLALVQALREKAWNGPAIVVCPEVTDAIRQAAQQFGNVVPLLRADHEHRLIQTIQKLVPVAVL